jgi:hypothetical protein
MAGGDRVQIWSLMMIEIDVVMTSSVQDLGDGLAEKMARRS